MSPQDTSLDPNTPRTPGPPPGCPAHAGAPALHGPEFQNHPADVYDRLRAHGPLARVELAPGLEATLVTGYEAALHVLRTPELFSKDPHHWKAFADGRVPADDAVLPMLVPQTTCLTSDGPEHARLREAVSAAIDRIDPVGLRAYVERTADELIGAFIGRGEADLVADYARTLPLLALARVFGWPDTYGERLVAAVQGVLDGGPDDGELAACLRDIVALKRAQPGDDVTSWLIDHPAGLTDDELVHHLGILLGAGTEPTQNLIANGLRLLLSDDRFAGRLAGGRMPVEEALDEILWTDPPIANYGVHYPLRDTEIDGVAVGAGEPLVISFAAANNDPRMGGGRTLGNRAHLAWSAGPHTCAARSSAHLIACVALETVLDRLPEVRLAVEAGDLSWRDSPFVRALTSLPVTFPAAA